MDTGNLADLWSELGLRDDAGPRFGRCVLHIGTEKTGTTTLQACLGANRAALWRAGLFVPASLSPYPVAANHERLTTYALADAKAGDDLRRAAGLGADADLPAHRAAVLEALRAEIAALPAAALPTATLLLSNEHCHSRLTEPAEVLRLRGLLAEVAEQVQVVVYLRPQHELAVSAYDQALKSGHADIPVLPDLAAPRTWAPRSFFDYQALLDRWAGVFGHDAIEPRLFRRDALRGGSIVDDFLAPLGVDAADLAITPDVNAAMGAARQAALNVVNRLARDRDQPLPADLRARLIARLQQGGHGPGRRPTRAQAQRFQDGFALGNEAVRAAWFPTRDTLFEPDYSAYPETADGIDEAAALATSLIG